jgi:hypothetical protein
MVRLSIGLGLLLVAGCTPATSRLEPYRDDATQAEALQRRAVEVCRQRRGADLPPHPFTSDGCSLWPDGPWVNCCLDHDIAYWCGGSSEDRDRADEAFRQCVAAESSTGMGTVMFAGVRVGSLPWYPLPFRWGYGWDWPRGFDPQPDAGP